MQISTTLTFDGDCEEAFALYARVLGATLAFAQRYGESPMASQVPESWRRKIAHATLALPGGGRLHGNDSAPGTFQPSSGFSLNVDLSDAAAARAAFDALAEGGQVTMALQETYWAAAFATLVDRFGITWVINCEAPPSA